MNCNRCNKEGAKPYKYFDNGSPVTVYLCDTCYSQLNGTVSEGKSNGLLGMERRCPSCGRTLKEIRRTGYFGCADCFFCFKRELVTVIDKFQNKVISAPEKKQRELAIMLLEDEYSTLLSKTTSAAQETAAIGRRLRAIEDELAKLGVNVDG